MNEYLILIAKCFFFYFIIIFALRIMGKREVGELSIFDIVIYLVMSELLALSITEASDSIMKALVPLFTLALMQIILSLVLLKVHKFRVLIEGKPVILIDHGIINQQAMRKERYNLDDLMNQLRDKNIATPQEVAYAILETSGHLSILPLNTCKVKYPFPLIKDGRIDHDVMEICNYCEEDLLKACQSNGIQKIEDVFLCLVQNNGLFLLKQSDLNAKGQRLR